MDAHQVAIEDSRNGKRSTAAYNGELIQHTSTVDGIVTLTHLPSDIKRGRITSMQKGQETLVQTADQSASNLQTAVTELEARITVLIEALQALTKENRALIDANTLLIEQNITDIAALDTRVTAHEASYP